jgi:2-keto-4-pentenoate hydratase/2-oxohepta-3-ene-1,7-dioic acid hydratase in catechol pathway
VPNGYTLLPPTPQLQALLNVDGVISINGTVESSPMQDAEVWLDVNGERRQASNTRDMIFTCAHIVSYCSRFMTLLPGDIITTGTPSGVALGIKDRNAFLKPGDVVTLHIKGLGEQRQLVLPLQR